MAGVATRAARGRLTRQSEDPLGGNVAQHLCRASGDREAARQQPLVYAGARSLVAEKDSITKQVNDQGRGTLAHPDPDQFRNRRLRPRPTTSH